MKRIEETRASIIDAAGKLFQKFGFEKTSMDEIAQVAHKAKRSLYYHFPGKEDLFLAVAEKELCEIREHLQAIFDNRGLLPIERLKNYLLRRMEFMENSISYNKVLRDEMQDAFFPRQSALTKIYADFEQWEHDRLIALWCDGEGGHPEKMANAVAFAGMARMVIRSLCVSFFVQGKYEEYKKTYTFLVNLIIDSIQNNELQQKTTNDNL